MNRMHASPRQLKELYSKGENISAYLRNEAGLSDNTREIIEIAYDLQAGSYAKAMEDKEMAAFKAAYSAEIAKTILSLCEPGSILEAGVGEATTLSGVIGNLPDTVINHGFDLSWSRLAYAKKWLHSQKIQNTLLCSGDLLNIPFKDNSIDVVYTSHSIEPNGGQEIPILRELYRVTRNYLVLLEPGYEFADDTVKKRMESHGYCKNLKNFAEQEGFEVVRHELFPLSVNVQNPTAIIVIRKGGTPASHRPQSALACPKYKTDLVSLAGMLYSPESLVVYPVIDNIPCLRIENGIFASHFQELLPK